MNEDYSFQQWNPQGTKKLIFLHGFTGSENSFQQVAENLSEDFHVIAPLLPGHGRADYKIPSYFMEDQVNWLRALIESMGLQEAAIAGYSMGGRLALGYAMRYPVESLIVVSSSPGIEDEAERLLRAQADRKLADDIRTRGLDWFVSYWESIPLFKSQQALPDSVKQTVRNERLQHDAHHLAQSLEQFSTGNMPSYWSRLNSYTNPVTLIVGELDTKFVSIGQKMKMRLENVELIEVPAVGHAIQVENPKMFATIIEDVLLRRQ
ncbi:2-succinyl-6-hydroxy-2,4-cyclohexadiene-1-carboxylate synthase [Chryseomicrobium sp. FSL W7-1435]|uniref:2-succinyl-6-hydroxy-2, 4-cyclohexadiene-1-carboxylate synthase n=1 Tax=Chryseomicrobium sp. FSL W7-1435 TaxID=2921704 RepID=UPI00315B23E8